MEEQTINYDDYTLDPAKDVLVPAKIYMVIHRIFAELEKSHSKVITTDKFAYYNNKTHEKLSKKSESKMTKEKLAERYYQNIDLEATENSIRVDREPLSLAAVKMLGELKGVFRHNVDQGNAILKQAAPESLTKPTESGLTK